MNRVTESCPRCGFGRVEGLPCASCWEGRADEALVAELVGHASKERIDTAAEIAGRLLAAIVDPRAAPALRHVVLDGPEGLRRAAVQSLGFIGDAADIPLLSIHLRDAPDRVRAASRAALANIGGEAARQALRESLEDTDGMERYDAVAALAWVGDRFDLDAARRFALESARDPDLGRGVHWRESVAPVDVLLRLGSDEDRRGIADAVLALVDEVDVDDSTEPARLVGLEHASRAVARLRTRLFVAGLEREVTAFWKAYEQRLDRAIPVAHRHLLARGVEVEPVEPRAVQRLSLAELREDALLDQPGPVAKFGGQPEWIEAPAWPLSPSGAPMVFLAQLPDYHHPGRMIYVFFSTEVDETWEPLGNGNAVVVQPGAPAHVPTAAQRTGPALFEQLPQPHRYLAAQIYRRYERFIVLEAGADPPAWTWPELPRGCFPAEKEGDWRKLGGTPAYLQGEDRPPGEGWRFAFQFNASWAGHEFADGAECYGFVTDDGRGAFLWQCH